MGEIASSKISSPANGEVHVWKIHLDRQPSEVRGQFDELSADEKSRARNLRRERDRNRYVVAHCELRRILGSYIGLRAACVRFTANSFGKPSLEKHCSWLSFNLSHSRGLALIAITAGRELGVDCEFIDEHFPIQKLASSIVSPAEYSSLSPTDPSLRANIFFRWWTRREAVLKAIGSGFAKEETHRADRNCKWSVLDLPVDQRYSAALAVEGEIKRVQFKSETGRI
jgi:4'-phosphopantetheinyl transferase